MARNVYKWPPVHTVATMWTVQQPIHRSRSFVTGYSLTSSAQRERLMAKFEVPGIGNDNLGGGYCEVLKKLLAGGQHLIRVNAVPVNWYFEQLTPRDFERSVKVEWDDGAGTEVTWEEPPTETVWLSGSFVPGTIGTDGSWDIVTLTGLPPNTLIARPGEYVTGRALAGLDADGSTAMVMRPATSDASGSVTIYLMSALTVAEHVEINARPSYVFEVDGPLPSATQPLDGNWSYVWPLRQVFEDEVGAFTEIDPWT
jgi:hypothetical protein